MTFLALLALPHGHGSLRPGWDSFNMGAIIAHEIIVDETRAFTRFDRLIIECYGVFQQSSQRSKGEAAKVDEFAGLPAQSMSRSPIKELRALGKSEPL